MKSSSDFSGDALKENSPQGAFVAVGRIKDAHGIRGELFIVLYSGEAAWLKQLNQLRLVNQAGVLEKLLTVKSARLHKNGLIVKTAELLDRNQAELLKGLVLEVPSEFFVSLPGEAIYLREILGFTVMSLGVGGVGEIVGFSSNGAQDLLLVKTSSGEYEVPFVADLVEHIDYEKRLVSMNLPFGLLGETDDEAR